MLHKYTKIKILTVFLLIFFSNNNILGSEAYFDLSEEQIQIQTDFNGKEIIIFGILELDEDTIVSIMGPSIDTKLSKKERLFGFWVNTKKIIYKKLPSIFFIASTSPIENILNNETIIKERLYFDRILTNIITHRNFTDQKNIGQWNNSLIDIKKTENLYKKYDLKNVDNKLFQTRVFFPANSTPGEYIVTIYQIKNKIIINKKNKIIMIKKSGIGNKIFVFAHQQPGAYGILSIIFAILAGLIAATVFRRL